MPEHNYDDVPVHVRTVHYPDTDEHYVLFGIEVGGHFYAFNSVPLDAFEQVLSDLDQQAAGEGQA
jgi:hypothetical protein